MPKNPVRAARQAGRQQVRAAKQASKVAKIQNRTQTKLGKIQGSTPASTTSSTPAPKFKTAAELKSTIKMPDMGASLNKLARESSIKNGTGTKAPAPATKKSAPTKKSTPKPKAGPQLTPQGKAAVEKANAERYRKDREQGTYITKPESRNQQQKDKVVVDNVKGTVAKLKALQDKAYKDSKIKAKAELNARRAQRGLPPIKSMGGGTTTDPYTTKPTATASTYKRSGVTLKKNPDGTYSKAKIGGAVKGKKC